MRTNLTLKDLPPMSEEEKNWWDEHNSEYCHYFYRIDNAVNGKFYYGIHSERLDSGKSPEEDGYMGSGTDLKKAQDEEGIENFKKTIIKTFSTRDEARLEEMIVVDEDLVNDPMCYNLALGGGCSGNTEGFLPVDYRDEKLRKGKFFLIPCEEYWKEPEKYIKPMTDKVVVNYRDPAKRLPHCFIVSTEEYQENKSKYIVPGSGYVTVKDSSGNSWKRITIEEYRKNKATYISMTKDRAPFKNKDNWDDVRFLTSDDPLVLSGQFIGVTKGLKQSQETIDKRLGEKNGSYGTMWITNGKENKKISNQDIPEGWWKGRVTDSWSDYINTTTGEVKRLLNSKPIPKDFVLLKFTNNGKLISPQQIDDALLQCGGSIKKASRMFNMKKGTLEELILIYETGGIEFKNKKEK